MRRLVALDLEGGTPFVTALLACFDDGDAVLPLDQRTPIAARRRLAEALGASSVIDRDGRHDLERGVPVEDGDAFVVATSGTTGEQKGVVLTHAAVRASALATSARLGVDPARDRWLCCLPLNHVGGLSVLTRALETDTPVEVQPAFSPTDTRDALRRGATLVSLVATALRRLDAAVAAGFRSIVLGGSAPPEGLAQNVVTTYGLTETGSGVVYDGVPLDQVQVRVDDEGSVLLAGPMLLRCYRDGRDPKRADGFLPTGDVGELDEQGRLVVFGRRGDVIVSGGEKIWPEPVEALLARHPGVAEVAVVGIDDEEWGRRAVACVVPRPGATVELEELRDLVRAELGPIYAPRQLCFVDHLPRTSIGKLRRSELARAITDPAVAR